MEKYQENVCHLKVSTYLTVTVLLLMHYGQSEGATFIPIHNWSWPPRLIYPPVLVTPPIQHAPLTYKSILRSMVHPSNPPQVQKQARHSVHQEDIGHGSHSDSDTHKAIHTILHSLVKTSNDTTFTCPEDGVNGTYPHQWDCSKYYLCEENQKPKEYDCLYDLTGLLFDSVSGTCVWANKAKCFSTIDDGFEAVEAEYDPDFECEEQGLFTDPEYCMRYFRCDKNLEVHLEYCSTGTFYDTNFKKCLWANNVICGDRSEVDQNFEDDIFRRFPIF